MATFNTGGLLISTATAAAATVTVTLDTPAAGQCNQIVWISCFAAAATAADVAIQKNDGTQIVRFGGAGIGILGQPLFFQNVGPRGGLCGVAADASKVVLTTTAGTTTQLSVGYQMVPT